MEKNKISGKEILSNILDSFYELDLNDKEERQEMLKDECSNIVSLQNSYKESLSKLQRNVKIDLERHKRGKMDLYEEAKKLYNSIPNINQFLKDIFSESELGQFKLAFRNLESGDFSDLDDIKKEMLLLKFIKDLKKENE